MEIKGIGLVVKKGIGFTICKLLRLKSFYNIVLNCLEKEGKSIMLIKEIEKKFENLEKGNAELKQGNAELKQGNAELKQGNVELKQSNQNLEKKLDKKFSEILKAIKKN